MRRTKLNPEIAKAVVEAITAGNTHSVACDYAGISESAFYNWIKRGRDAVEAVDSDEEIPDSELIYVEFMEGVKKATANAVARNVLIIQKAAKRSWQAAAWWLERRFPQDFGRVDRHKLEHSGDVGITINYIDATDHELDGNGQTNGHSNGESPE